MSQRESRFRKKDQMNRRYFSSVVIDSGLFFIHEFLYKCTSVLLYSCTLLYSFTTVLLYSCTAVLLCSCIPVLLKPCSLLRSRVQIPVEPKLFSVLCTPFCTPYGVLGVPISKVPHFGVHGM